VKSGWWGRIGAGGAMLAVALLIAGVGIGRGREWTDADWGRFAGETYTFVAPGDAPPDQVRTVIGQMETYTPTTGDTFYDIGRYFDLGYNEIVAANPGVDVWIPGQGDKDVEIPRQWVLPCCNFEGLIVNIPEMRVYYYPKRPKGAPRTVITYPVGLGRTDWKTPQGKFRITEKTKDPTWVIPESIRKERIADKGFSEKAIPGGSPDNPMGRYRMRVSLDIYSFHGTNIPWGVGMFVSHGCIRFYPEDIERLFPTVPTGTPGEFIYQTVKVGTMNDRIFVEVHEDIYGMQPGRWRTTITELQKRGLLDRVDEEKLHQAVYESRGVPVDVTRETLPPSSNEPGRPGIHPLPATQLDADDKYPSRNRPATGG
jgi:L,D-transpeptidase ErfK/SrfK